MKKISRLYTFLFAFLMASIASYACDIDFDITNGKKTNYSKNDELTAKVTVKLFHRNCSEGIGKTTLNPKGLQIVSATKWVEKSSGVFERKLKLKITASKGKATLFAERICSKDGGEGTLTLPVK